MAKIIPSGIVYNSMTTHYQVNSKNVISELIENELVVIDISRGVYYSIAGSGTAIWKAIEAQASLKDMLEMFAINQPQDAEDIQSSRMEFVNRLLKENLIIEDTSNPTKEHSLPASTTRLSFTPPGIEKYDDLKELILLDTIHEA